MNVDFTSVPKHYGPRTDEKMREVLMDPNAPGPAIHYYMIRGGIDQKNVTVWEPGTIGSEYIKTYGHYHIGNLDETYWIVYGEGVAILQKLASDSAGNLIDDVVEEFRAIPVQAGSEIYMPPGYGHAVANTGSTYLVTIDNTPVNFTEVNPTTLPGHADYEPVKRMQGFAFYVVEENGKPALKANPKYREVKKTEFNGLPLVK